MEKFWKWYQKHYRLNVGVAAGLFILQLVHLYWLTTDVVWQRLFDASFFNPSGFWRLILAVVDYTEVPAILTASLVYLRNLRQNEERAKSWLLLFFINSQWLHIFWITDEVVIDTLTEKTSQTILPPLVAWLAIVIDYLELPVIFDTIKKTIRARTL